MEWAESLEWEDAALFKQYEGIWENMQICKRIPLRQIPLLLPQTIEMRSQVLCDLVVYGKTAQIYQRKHMNKTFKYS